MTKKNKMDVKIEAIVEHLSSHKSPQGIAKEVSVPAKKIKRVAMARQVPVLKLAIKRTEDIDNIRLLQKTLQDEGYDLTLRQCEEVWELYSETFECGWLSISLSAYREFIKNLKKYIQ